MEATIPKFRIFIRQEGRGDERRGEDGRGAYGGAT